MRLYTATANDNDYVSFISPLLSNKHIVALDGMELTGKTNWFSGLMLRAVGRGKIIHIDDYVKKQNGRNGLYIIKSREEFKKDIQAQSEDTVIIEGIMAKEKLSNINVIPDLWIYLKRMVIYGWEERDWLDKAFIDEYGNSGVNFHLGKPRSKQIYKYHIKFQPQVNADIVVEIDENLYK